MPQMEQALRGIDDAMRGQRNAARALGEAPLRLFGELPLLLVVDEDPGAVGIAAIAELPAGQLLLFLVFAGLAGGVIRLYFAPLPS